MGQAAQTARGSITFDGNQLVVRFPFNKRRFSEIKRIREARFDKNGKCWRLPAACLSRLESFASFAPGQIAYDFDRDLVEQTALRLEAARNKSVERILANPFFVSEKDAREANVSVLLTIAEKPRGVRVTLARYSRARSIIEGVPEAIYIKKSSQYFFPVDKVPGFLKQLRNKNILFAVEEQAGLQLQGTAEIRKQLLDDGKEYGWQDLRGAFLVPFIRRITDSAEDYFCLQEFTNEQLRLLFPETGSFFERKASAKNLNEEQLLSVLDAGRKNNVKVWLDKETRRFIESKADQYREIYASGKAFPDSLLSVSLPEAFWSLDQDGKALLGMQRSFLSKVGHDQIQTAMNSSVQITVPWAVDCRVYRLKDTEVLEAYQSVEELATAEGAIVSPGKDFLRLLYELRKRQKRLDRQKELLALKDIDLLSLESTLAKRLFPHQRIAVQWLSENSYGLLGDDMGLGKTLSILTGFHQRFQSEKVKKLLVVCPQSLVGNWKREVDLWFPDYVVQIAEKGKKKQERQLEDFRKTDSFHGLIINFESFRIDRLYPLFVEIAKEQDIFLVVDESQRVKNSESKTFKALATLARHTPYRFLLSGTPAPRDIGDIWAQMYLLDFGERFGGNYIEWLKTVAELGNNWSDFAVVRFLPEAIEETVSRVQEVLLRRRKEAVVDLPEKLFVTRDVPLKGDQQKRYDEIREQLLMRVTDLKGDEGYREIQSVLEEYLRAVQVASNPRLVDPLWKGQPAKFVELDLVVEEVVGSQGGKVVIWTNYLLNVDELLERYASFGAVSLTGAVPADERADLVASFQSTDASSPKVFIAIPAAGGVGITLTAAQTVVYLDKSWNAEHYLQSIDRVHRIGQAGTVTILNLHSTPVDELIARNLKKKEKNQKALLGDKPLSLTEIIPDRDELLEALKQ